MGRPSDTRRVQKAHREFNREKGEDEDRDRTTDTERARDMEFENEERTVSC